jgi:hypothetical protein
MSEREIMASFAFKHEINMDNQAHSSLSESMSVEGDHVFVSYNTEFEGNDLNKLRKKMRSITPKFSDEGAFMRDV